MENHDILVHYYGDADIDNEVVISESDEEYVVNNNEDVESDSNVSMEDEEGCNSGSDDNLSDFGESFDKIGDEHSDEDMEEVYIDRGMRGQPFARQPDGKIILQPGHLFLDVHAFREVLSDYVIQEGFEIIRLKNEKARVIAKCKAVGCEWRIHASPTPDGVTYKIKTYNSFHNCIRQTKNSNATSTWIVRKLKSKLKADPDMKYSSMKAELLEKFGIEAHNLMQLYRARRRVKEDSKGTHGQSYNKLPAWADLARQTNPGSLIKLELQSPKIGSNPEFKRFFVSFDAMKKGFVKGCRPWFGIDGCHLKGPYGGVLLAAVAIDGNKGQFPIAFAVVEIECIASWKFFLYYLKEAFDSVPGWTDHPLTIMSDMQKGLTSAVAEFFPLAKHKFCCNHLLNNFKLKFKTLLLTEQFWAMAFAHNEFLFEKAIKQMRDVSNDAADWLLATERPKHMWARHTIDPHCKSDHITNNVCESFNSWVGDDRKKTILSMVESLATRLMRRFQRRYEKGCNFEHRLCTRIRKVVDIKFQDGRYCGVSYAGDGEFQVKDGYTTFVVNLMTKSCGCGYWLLCGLPYKHACACISYMRYDVEKYCDDYYSKEKYCSTYDEILHPMPELDQANTVGYAVIVDPPTLKRLQGRPRRNRKRGPHEGPARQSDARRSSTVRCSTCKEFGHNKAGCQRAKTKKQLKMAIREFVGGAGPSQHCTPTEVAIGTQGGSQPQQ